MIRKKLILILFVFLSFYLFSCAVNKEEVKKAGPSIIGIVYDESGIPLDRAIISIYLSNANLFHGPDNYHSNFTGNDGAFSLDLPDGNYYIVARKRINGAYTGPLTNGDYNGEYANNPIKVISGKTVKVEITAQKIEGLMLYSPMNASRNHIQLKGIVKDKSGNFKEGMFVVGYTSPTMWNKPDYISQPTNAKGEFVLYVDKPGTYYLLAKQVFKKPPVVGELVGNYAGSNDHGIEVKDEKGIVDLILIVAPFTEEQLKQLNKKIETK
ncbi:carboxypeptidase regulatory-like domain-containing protein [Candidatus Desantisbacteria bacterium]|nr:carboxypeptidase regulatory-like domain-containing protein [Candidatus Desantisbacteria bacterium]